MLYVMKKIDYSVKKVPPILTRKELRKSAFYVPQPCDDFLMTEHSNVHCGKSVRQTSDVYMLFNQQRLDRMSRDALLQRFENMAVSDSSLNSLRKKMTDDQLAMFVKSRYIQTPSELLSWSNYLNTLAETELAAIKDSLPKFEPSPAPQPEPASAPEPQ